jgi:predicted phage tail protein
MLAPQPKTPGTPDRPENKPSYVFDGPINTAAQGNPVPVCYGRLIVGSQVISAGMVAEEYAP